MGISDVIDSRKIFFITGKGGTGKSTYTVSLGKLSALRYRTLIVDFDNKRSTIREIVRCQNLSTEPQLIENNLFFSHIEPEDALRFYLNDYLKSDFLINMAVNLKPLKSFYNALPSAKEMLITYFLLHLVKDYNFEKIFIDMPASGHAELFMKIPQSARGIFKKGPVISIANEMNRWIYRDDISAVIQIALPEEVVISETIEFYRKFNAIENINVILIIVNKVYNLYDTEPPHEQYFQNENILNLYNYYLMRFREQKTLIDMLSQNTGTGILTVPFFTDRNPSLKIFDYIRQQ
ncbi:MAG: AAA family ATPase [Deltaproteobacteria bacterium]|nr:AAA family ATPase [Deltaproteobacteria bacterium]